MTTDELADRQAIIALAHRYCDAITRNDWDQHESCFAPDAVWEVGAPANRRLEGASGIRAGTEAAISSFDFIVQNICSVVIDLETSDRASARVVLQETGRAGGGARHFTQFGVYYDRLVKIDGAWRFASRRFEFIYADPTPLPGEVITPRAKIV